MQNSKYPSVPALELIGNVLPTLKPFFEFIAFLSKPENAKAIRQALEDSERFFREQDRALLAFAVNNRWIGLEHHFTSEQLLLLMRFATENGEDAANARVPELFRIERIEEMVTKGKPGRGNRGQTGRSPIPRATQEAAPQTFFITFFLYRNHRHRIAILQ